MGRKRVALDTDDDSMHDEPFVTRADYIKSRIDRDATRRNAERTPRQEQSPQAENDRGNQERTGQRSQGSSRRTGPSRIQGQSQQQSQRKALAKDAVSEAVEHSRNGNDAEELAVQKLVERLQEKGASDAFIRENMEKIRERARQELLD